LSSNLDPFNPSGIIIYHTYLPLTPNEIAFIKTTNFITLIETALLTELHAIPQAALQIYVK
jgi:hypothetical protein